MIFNEKAAHDTKIEAAHKSSASELKYTPDTPMRNALLSALDDVVRAAQAEGRTVPEHLLAIWRRHHG